MRGKNIGNRGITLIALVITIVILIILAGISLGAIAGNDGILNKANTAKKDTEYAQWEEKIESAKTDAEKKNMNPTLEDVIEELKDNGVIDEESQVNKETGAITTNKPVYTIEGKLNDYLGKEDDVEIAGGSWDEEKGVNTPVLKENMELVKWDESTKEFVTDETNSSYDYNNQQWANARVTIDGIESYFVWIPRFEYKIDSTNKTIDVKFISKIKTTPDKGYIIHPAFTSDVDNGGWSSELPGIWVGKYETSRSDSKKGVQGTSTKVKVQPGVMSWRDTINNVYKYAKEYSTNLNSHMLKNSEWGAVAYLTHSKYGRNGVEVTINNSSDFTTGSAGNSVSAEEDVGTTSDYWSEQGVLASSTGNVTGIYDLSGGSIEFVAAYIQGGSADDGTLLLNETDKKFVTVYTGEDISSAYKLGDATYETYGWNDDEKFFLTTSEPFFRRGGGYYNASEAGIFEFNRGNGNTNTGSFRMCLAII